MFALVSILGLCLSLALWRAFRDHPNDRVRLSEEKNVSITEHRRFARTSRECGDGIGWFEDPAYDIDPRSSDLESWHDDVWEFSGDTIILHVDSIVANPYCIKTMSVAVGGSIEEFQSPVANEVSLNNTGWDGCTPIEASVTLFDEQNRTDRREKNIEPEETCTGRVAEQLNSAPPAGTAPGEERANVAGPVLGAVVLCIVVVVLVLGVARMSIGRGTRRATVSTDEEESNEDIPMRPMKENSLRRNRVSKRKSQIRERVDQRMRNEPPLDVEGCEYSFVEDYGTAYDRNQEGLSEEGFDDVDISVKRDRSETTICDNSSVV